MKISPLREFIWSAMLWLPLMFALWFALSTVVAFPIVRLAHVFADLLMPDLLSHAGQNFAQFAYAYVVDISGVAGLPGADLMRALPMSVPVDWMAVSSYGSGTKSSGVVRILKDLEADISGKHVLIVEDIVDSGLTLSWIKSNLESRNPASVEICTMLRKPDAAKVKVDVRWVGFDIPNEFVVGYGLDYAERYRGLRDVATLAPHVYS